MMRTLLLTSLLSLAATSGPAFAGDCGCGAPSNCQTCQPCRTCQGRCHHCRHHWCEPPPQGMVVASYPAFPVAAFPVQAYAAPASYTLNIPAAAPQSRLDDAALNAIQRYLDDTRAKAPTSCNSSKSMSPLQAPAIPSETTETRLANLEEKMESMQKSVKQILDLVKPRDGK